MAKKIGKGDFIVITCALTQSSYHLLDESALNLVKPGVRIVNVGRGPVVDEKALERALRSGKGFLRCIGCL